MALKTGTSAEVIAENVAELVKVGYTQDHAAAIASAAARYQSETDEAAAARRAQNARATTAQIFDRAATYFTVHQLGKTRRLTPEGFLICEGVPIARIGEQLYSASELNQDPAEKPIDADGRGLIVVRRLPDEVFRPESMASAEGKPVTVEHPDCFVTPETHKKLSVGHAQNIRRGAGIEDDLLVADLVITAPDAIAYVNRDLPEISVGYTAKYFQDEPGIAYQRDIVINHIAMVERGRAGPRVSIKDAQPSGDFRMKIRDIVKLFLPNVATNDNAAVTAALDTEVPGISAAPTQQQTTDSTVLAAIQQVTSRLETMDTQIKDLVKARATEDEEETEAEKKKREEEEAKKKSEDEAASEIEKAEATDTILEAESPGAVLNLGTVYTGDSAGAKPDPFKEIVSRAEILAPGIQIPTKDSIKGTKGAALATFMRQALEKCATNDSSKDAAATFLMGRKVGDLKGHALLGAFNGTAELVRMRNNRGAQRMAGATKTTDFGAAPKTNAELNKISREFWAKQAGR